MNIPFVGRWRAAGVLALVGLMGVGAPLRIAESASGTPSAVPVSDVVHAAQSQGFVGLTRGGRIIRFAAGTLPGVSTPVRVSGLRAGDAIAALDRAPSGELLALGRSTAIYRLDPRTGRATEQTAPFGAPIAADAPVTFAIAAGGGPALVIAPGIDTTVNLTTGATTAGTPPAYAAGDTHAGQTLSLVAGTLPDGRLTGIDAAHGDFVVQQSVGGPFATVAAIPGPAAMPMSVTVAPDGGVWLATRLRNDGRPLDESRLMRLDPATGRVTRANGPFVTFELLAVASVGAVPEPTAPPVARIDVRARESLRAIRAAHGVTAGVRLLEGGQVTASTRDAHGRELGFGFATRVDPGHLTVTAMSNRTQLRELERMVGRSVRLHLTVHDFAHGSRSFDRSVEIVR